MNLKLFGVRVSTENEVAIKASKYGDLYVAQGLPAGAVLTQQGEGWEAMSTAAVAALVVRPSTTALVTLWNGESAGGKSYIIERAFAQQLVSGAAESRWGIWLCVHPVGMAAVTNDITARNNTRGRAATSTNSRFDVDATVVDNGWYPWGDSKDVEPTGVLGGGQKDVPINGRIIIPPTAGLSLHVVASSVNEDFCAGFHWYEKQIDLP